MILYSKLEPGYGGEISRFTRRFQFDFSSSSLFIVLFESSIVAKHPMDVIDGYVAFSSAAE